MTVARREGTREERGLERQFFRVSIRESLLSMLNSTCCIVLFHELLQLGHGSIPMILYNNIHATKIGGCCVS